MKVPETQTVLAFDVGIVNLAFCVLQRRREKKSLALDQNQDKVQWKILRWEVINVLDLMQTRYQKATQATTPVLIRMLNVLLPQMFPLAHTFDTILIEQQNARMRAQQKCVHVSYILYQHFQRVNACTRLVSANGKFVAKKVPELQFEQPAFSLQQPATTTTASSARTLAKSTIKQREYQQRKRYCVEGAQHFLACLQRHAPMDHEKFLDLLSTRTKQDSDAADALLLAFVAFL